MAAAKNNHREKHHMDRVGWLRASVMGANDGILSTASLVVGVAAAHSSKSSVLVAGISGLVAGALSMAAGEYVSVSSQSDAERADLDRERMELDADNAGEHKELESIYVERGLVPKLAKQVSDQLMSHDALEAHARDELGISVNSTSHPVQAALSSAGTFALGATVPLIVVLLASGKSLASIVFGTTLFFLAGLGTLSALAGGAPVFRAAFRVTLWGALTMGLTAVVGAIFGKIV